MTLYYQGPIGRTTRRLSNVSDRVSDRVRKLSTAMGMGWKSSIPKDLLISQGKCLCSQYIRCRLKRSGFTNHKKLGLQRMRSVLSIGVSEVREVFPALLAAVEELERLHPKLYLNVSRQISNIHDLSSAEAAPILLGTVGRILFKNNEITWGKIVSLFCITGGLAEDLLRQQHIDFVPKLIDGFAGVLEDELVSWLSENHGWIALAHRLQIKKESCVYEWTVVIVLFIIVISFFSLVNTYIISTKYINVD